MPIDEKWLQTVDQIVSTAIAGKKRIIGVTSPDGSSGVTMLSKILAESFSLARVKTLLIDFSEQKNSDHEGGEGWIPALKEPSGYLQKNPKGYDLLESRPDHQNRFIFNNTDKLRGVLDDQLADYETIILDLPPIHAQNTGINAISCAATCDLAYLICLTGHVNSSDLKDVKDQLAAANVQFHGVILNDRDYEPTGDGIARQLLKLKSFVPGVEKFAEQVRKLDVLR